MWPHVCDSGWNLGSHVKWVSESTSCQPDSLQVMNLVVTSKTSAGPLLLSLFFFVLFKAACSRSDYLSPVPESNFLSLRQSSSLIGPLTLQACRLTRSLHGTPPWTTQLFVTSYDLVWPVWSVWYVSDMLRCTLIHILHLRTALMHFVPHWTTLYLFGCCLHALDTFGDIQHTSHTLSWHMLDSRTMPQHCAFHFWTLCSAFMI
jgi:hypothetical protein